MERHAESALKKEEFNNAPFESDSSEESHNEINAINDGYECDAIDDDHALNQSQSELEKSTDKHGISSAEYQNAFEGTSNETKSDHFESAGDRNCMNQMKLLWVILDILQVQVPPFYTVMQWRKKFGSVKVVKRITSSGSHIFVQLIPDLVEKAFGNYDIASKIQRAPQLTICPKEMYEMQAFYQQAPFLFGCWENKYLYR
ncbi:hypothetical protein HDU80_001102 [Chytriomyces hyalinus]|nr:hypothetical protein HDU80_001102 [Chytriomyces hyalinus]